VSPESIVVLNNEITYETDPASDEVANPTKLGSTARRPLSPSSSDGLVALL
jgi:hypothetical protein